MSKLCISCSKCHPYPNPQALVEMGYQRGDVEAAAKHLLDTEGSVSAESLFERLFTMKAKCTPPQDNTTSVSVSDNQDMDRGMCVCFCLCVCV